MTDHRRRLLKLLAEIDQNLAEMVELLKYEVMTRSDRAKARAQRDFFTRSRKRVEQMIQELNFQE